MISRRLCGLAGPARFPGQPRLKRERSGRRPRLLGALALGILLISGCSGERSPEDELRALIAAGEHAAEAKQLFTLKGLISERYRDQDRRDRRALVSLIAGYFLRNKTVHLLTRMSEVRLEGPDRAEIAFYLAAAGQPMDDFETLIPLHGDLFWVELVAVREGGDWRVLSARWRRAEQSEILKRMIE